MGNISGEALRSAAREPIQISFKVIKGDSLSPSTSSGMIYYTVDPHFASLIFSIYSRHERLGLGLSLLPDALSFNAYGVSSAVLAYAQTVGLQLVALGEQYANTLSRSKYEDTF